MNEVLALSQDDSPCILLPGQALPLEQPRISRLSRPHAPLDSWRTQTTFGLCDFHAAGRQGQERDEERNAGSMSEGQPAAGKGLYFLPTIPRSCQQHPLLKRVRLSPPASFLPTCPVLASRFPPYSRSRHISGVESGRPRLVNSVFKKRYVHLPET